MATFTCYNRDFSFVTCCNCGVEFLMPVDLNKNRRQDHGRFYCPNGHGQNYLAETEAEKMRRERDQARQQIARAEDERREAEVAKDRAERALARHKKRSAAGTCPCCQRTFSNMARHMKTEHPNYAAASGANVVPLQKTA